MPYFETLIAHPAFWKGYSLRPLAGAPKSSPYYEKQLLQRQHGGYAQSNSKPVAVTYDAGMDAAQIVIQSNNLSNQVYLPFKGEEGHTYLVTWDAWFPAAMATAGIPNWKTWQFSYPHTVGGTPGIWAEVQTMFSKGIAPNLARVRMRQYSSTPRNGPDGTGSVATTVNVQVAPATWTRYWIQFAIPPFGSGDVLVTLWVADPSQPARVIYDRVPWRRAVPGQIKSMWLEYNTSTEDVAPNRGPLYCYLRNVAMLRDVPAGDLPALVTTDGL